MLEATGGEFVDTAWLETHVPDLEGHRVDEIHSSKDLPDLGIYEKHHHGVVLCLAQAANMSGIMSKFHIGDYLLGVSFGFLG